MNYRRLGPHDCDQYLFLRLAGLREAPTAFISTEAEEAALPMTVVAERLRHTPDAAVFGAWDGDVLCALSGIYREQRIQLRHKATLWGVYVAPDARRSGTARAIIGLCLQFARDAGVERVNLGVNVSNGAAIRLYESFGFRPYGIERGFMRVAGVLQDEMHMVCALNES